MFGLSYGFIGICAGASFLFYRKVIKTLIATICLVAFYAAVVIVGNTYAQRQFYGVKVISMNPPYVIMPGQIDGLAISPEKVVQAAAAYGRYNCDDVANVDGTNPEVFYDDNLIPICCIHSQTKDGFFTPYKIVGNELHVLCGTFPNQSEVITSIPSFMKT